MIRTYISRSLDDDLASLGLDRYVCWSNKGTKIPHGVSSFALLVHMNAHHKDVISHRLHTLAVNLDEPHGQDSCCSCS